MQRGSLLQPIAQQNSFCQGRLAARKLARLSPAPARATHTAAVFVGLILSPLSRSTERGKPPSGRFSSRLFYENPHSFPGGSPAGAPLPPRPSASPLFPIAVTVSCLLLRRCRNRASPVCSQVKWGWGSHSSAGPDENRSQVWSCHAQRGATASGPAARCDRPAPAYGFLWAQLFRSTPTAISSAASLLRPLTVNRPRLPRPTFHVPQTHIFCRRLRKVSRNSGPAFGLPCRGRGISSK